MADKRKRRNPRRKNPNRAAARGKRPNKRAKKLRVVKTDNKSHRPFTLRNPIILDEEGNISPDLTRKAREELKQMCLSMSKCEEYYYANDFENLIRELSELEDRSSLGGKKNSALRGFLDEVPNAIEIPNPKQTYNFMEMVRTNIGSKVQLHIMLVQLEEVISEDPELAPKAIRKKYIERFGEDDAPSTSSIKKHVAAFKKTGKITVPPSPSGLIPLSACDGHYRKIDPETHSGWIIVRLKLACGNVMLCFERPRKGKRYSKGKVTAPTLRYDAVLDEILYDFTLQGKRPKKAKAEELSGMLGIDLGVVHTMVTTFVSRDFAYSQPFFESGRVARLEDRIKALFSEIDVLDEKARECDANGWFDKANELYEQAGLKRRKISRLKRLKSVLAAGEAVAIALELNAGLAVEDLSWVPESHWDQAAFQSVLADLAADVGLPVVKVSPADTSKRCSTCGTKLVERSGRIMYCPCCDHEIDRDINSPRNIALRALDYDIGDLKFFTYRLYQLGSRADRRLRVDRARRYKSSEENDSQRPCKVPTDEACDTADATSPACQEKQHR